MKNSTLNRPEKDIEIVTSIIAKSKLITMLMLKNGVYFDIGLVNRPSVMLIESGEVVLHRKHDNKIIMKIISPFPIGMLNTQVITRNYYLYCKTDSVIKILDRDEFIKHVALSEAWNSMFNVVSYFLDVALEQQNKVITIDNNYDLIKICLSEVWKLPEEEKKVTSLYDYIMNRHRISKSSITKVLKALNDGGYIKTKRAILMEFNFLPEKY